MQYVKRLAAESIEQQFVSRSYWCRHHH
jgi:hypothetical protein